MSLRTRLMLAARAASAGDGAELLGPAPSCAAASTPLTMPVTVASPAASRAACASSCSVERVTVASASSMVHMPTRMPPKYTSAKSSSSSVSASACVRRNAALARCRLSAPVFVFTKLYDGKNRPCECMHAMTDCSVIVFGRLFVIMNVYAFSRMLRGDSAARPLLVTLPYSRYWLRAASFTSCVMDSDMRASKPGRPASFRQ